MAEIDLSLLPDFIVEANEHLEHMESELLRLQPGQDNTAICNDIFRPIHTIKGASQFVGLERVSRLAHRMEDLLDLLRQGQCPVTAAVIDTLIDGRDLIAQLVHDLEQTEQEGTDVEAVAARVSALIDNNGELPGGAYPEAPSPDEIEAPSPEGIEAPSPEGIEAPSPDEIKASSPDEVDAPTPDQVEAPEPEPMESAPMEGWEVAAEGDEAGPASAEESEESEEYVYAADAEPNWEDEIPEEFRRAVQARPDAGDEAEPEAAPVEGSIVYGEGAEPAIHIEFGYEQEYDPELFDIFLRQLQDKLSLLAMLSRALDASDEQGEILRECEGHVTKLRYAANYMGYDELVEFYDQWLEEMGSALYQVHEAGVADTSFMHGRIARVVDAFPQLQPAEGAEPESPAPAEAAADEGHDLEDAEINDFINEALEHLDQLENSLLALAADPNAPGALDSIFRASHTIKGVSQFVGLARVAAVAHRMEDLLALIRNGQRPCDARAVEVLINAKDRLNQLIEDLETTQREQTPVDDVVAQLEALIQAEPSAPAVTEPVEPEPEPKPATEQMVYEEEHDEELFEIFLGQLRTLLPAVRGWVDRFEASQAPRDLWTLVDAVQRLRFSANYMGYDELRALYDDWLQRMDDAQERIGAVGPVHLGFVDDYLNRVAGFFPIQLADWRSIPLDEAAIAAFQTEAAIAAFQTESAIAAFQSEAAIAASEVEPPAMAAEGEAAAEAEPAPVPALEAPAEPASQPVAPVPAAADELLIRLTEALEAGDSASSQAEYETLHSVFEEMLGAPAEPKAPAPQAEAPAPAAAPKPAAAPARPAPPAPAAAKAQVAEAPEAAPKPPKPAPAAPKPPKSAPSTEPPKPSVAESAAPEAEAPPARPSAPKAPEPAKAAGGAGQPPKGKEEEGEGDGEEKKGQPSERAFKKSVRVDADKIDALMNQVGELIVDRSYFFQLYNEVGELQRHLRDDLNIDSHELKQVRAFAYRLGEAISSLSRTSNELQEGVMKVRMLPISQLFNRYPRLIHDLTNGTNKKVNLVIKGEETELDKMIVEELSDPLIHIIRNSVDHGLEPRDERKRLGKPEQGTLVVEAYQESNHIVIEVSDDGRGIDPERIKAKALEKKLNTKDELDRMSSRDLIRMIMLPGFSTAEKISRTSGRGVGMDVARKNIEKLNGTIEIESKVGIETRIRLKIPLTLAIIQALLVRVGKESFTIPLSNVEETLRILETDTSLIEGVEVVHLRGRTMPIFRLGDLFNVTTDHLDDSKSFVVVVNAGNDQVGLVVDELMGQDEVVIKPLVDYLQEKSGFSGATIIGDGRISLILDVYELVNMTANRQWRRVKDLESKRRISVGKAEKTQAAEPVATQ